MARSSCQDDEPDVSWDSKERPFWGLNNPCGNHHDGAMSDNPPTLENLYWIQLGKVVVELDKMTDWIDGRIPIAARKAPKAWALGFHAFAHSLGRTEDEMKRESYCIKLPGVEDPISVADELGWANFMDELADKMALDPGYQCRKPPPVALVCTQKQASRFVNDGWQDAAILASQSEDVIRPNSGVAAASTMLAGVSLGRLPISRTTDRDTPFYRTGTMLTRKVQIPLQLYRPLRPKLTMTVTMRMTKTTIDTYPPCLVRGHSTAYGSRKSTVRSSLKMKMTEPVTRKTRRRRHRSKI